MDVGLNFKEGLIEAIKVAGQMIIDSAEDIAGKTEHMSHLNISVDFDPEMRSIPEMTISRSHLPKIEKIEHILDTFTRKKEKPDIALVVCRDCGRIMKDYPDLKFYTLPDNNYLCKDCNKKTSEPVTGEVRYE